MPNDATRAPDPIWAGRTRRPTKMEEKAALETAIHELRLEGRIVDADAIPEFARVLAGDMTSDKAVASIIARMRRS